MPVLLSQTLPTLNTVFFVPISPSSAVAVSRSLMSFMSAKHLLTSNLIDKRTSSRRCIPGNRFQRIKIEEAKVLIYTEERRRKVGGLKMNLLRYLLELYCY
jgi:hypothetical protein